MWLYVRSIPHPCFYQVLSGYAPEAVIKRKLELTLELRPRIFF